MGGSLAKCEFDVYVDNYGNTADSDLICSDDLSDGNGIIYTVRDNFIYYMNESNINILNISSTLLSTYCHVVADGYLCDELNFYDPFNDIFFLDSSNNQITSTSGSISTPAVPDTPQGITFTCGSNNDIKYD